MSFAITLRARNPGIGVARLAALLVISLLLTACANLPSFTRPPATLAITDFAQTPLAGIIAPVLPEDGRSGFRLQPYGPNSFATRLELSKLASRSLDVQYYLLQGDNTGRALMGALRDAALRGVRVRILIDDLYTAGDDALLLGLAAYPNVEVRLFNPFPAGRDSNLSRFVSSAFDFNRINRRMHNKLFIADNVAAVAGGRNMADEYVMNATGSNFVDMDTFVAGPVVRDLSAAFDAYWNSEVVFPVRIVARSTSTPEQLRKGFEQNISEAVPPRASRIPENGRPLDPVDGEPSVLPLDLVPMLNLPFELAEAKLTPLILAPARVVFDPISKTEGFNEAQDSVTGTVTGAVISWFMTARSNIRMVSPYFVPSASGVASLVRARNEGIDVELITNSLASTDEPSVYVGYEAHVKPLLRAGVRIWELSPSLSVERHKLGLFGNRRGALHMKNAIVDHHEVFLGSMNLDQRSAKLNTELGLIITSEEMAQQLESFGDAGSSYELRLSDDLEHVQWIEVLDDGNYVVYDVPPETTAWQRLWLRLVGPLIPEREL